MSITAEFRKKIWQYIWMPSDSNASHAHMLYEQILETEKLRAENRKLLNSLEGISSSEMNALDALVEENRKLRKRINEERKRTKRGIGANKEGDKGHKAKCPYCEFVDQERKHHYD